MGFMGSGKTVVGKALAKTLNHEFVDTDELVEERESRSISEIFARDGEDRFRKLEREVLETLTGRERLVIATGGGLFLSPAARRFIRQTGASVWLDTPIEIIWKRSRDQGGRPLFGELPELKALLEKRRPGYEEADHHVDVRDRPVADVVNEICGWLKADPSE